MYHTAAYDIPGILQATIFAGTAVGEIIKIGGWKTERVARYYIESTTSAGANSEAKGKRDAGFQRARDNSYAIAMNFPLSQAFQDDFAARKQR